MTSASTALVLDLDGVVSAIHPTAPTWGDEVLSTVVMGRVMVSPTLVQRLDAVGALSHVHPLWSTSWSPLMRAQANLLPGRDWDCLDPESRPRGAGRWWKLSSLLDWLDQHPEIDRVVWVDDDLRSLWRGDEVRGAESEFTTRGVTLVTIAPRSEVGIDPSTMHRIETVVRGDQ